MIETKTKRHFPVNFFELRGLFYPMSPKPMAVRPLMKENGITPRSPPPPSANWRRQAKWDIGFSATRDFTAPPAAGTTSVSP